VPALKSAALHMNLDEVYGPLSWMDLELNVAPGP